MRLSKCKHTLQVVSFEANGMPASFPFHNGLGTRLVAFTLTKTEDWKSSVAGPQPSSHVEEFGISE